MKKTLAELLKHSADTGTGSASGQETEAQEPATEVGDDGVETFKGPQSQSELDSLINKAVHKSLENYKKGEQDRIAEAIKKEKDYANLSAAERERKEFEDQQAQFAKERAAFEQEKLIVQVTKDLAEKGLPVEFAELLAVGDAETALEKVGVFESAFNKAVNAKVKESLRQDSPRSGGTGASSTTNYGACLGATVAQNSGKLVD
ncbi:hypothetical protein ABID29_001823 [Streptococcus rupicaprae]|uniref:DUF4355 domain-containing protein n=1 Tax=Streptococcus rupicaprae TaxID=759619 RepID=A0ABV2FJG3_9STRE